MFNDGGRAMLPHDSSVLWVPRSPLYPRRPVGEDDGGIELGIEGLADAVLIGQGGFGTLYRATEVGTAGLSQ